MHINTKGVIYLRVNKLVVRQGCKKMSLNHGGIPLEGSIIQRVDAPTTKALVPILVLTLGTKSKSELGDRS